MKMSQYEVTLSYIMTYGNRECTHNEVVKFDTQKAAEFEYDRIDSMMSEAMAEARLREYDKLEAELVLTYQYGTHFTEFLASKVYQKEGK